MWKRKELKDRAKKVVHKNYWTAIVVCFLIALFTVEFVTSLVALWQSGDSMDPNYVIHRKQERLERQEDEIDSFFTKRNIKETLSNHQWKILETVEDNLNSAMKSQKYIFKIWDAITSFNINQTKLGVLLCIAAILAFAFTVFIADPLIVGGKKYFLRKL